MPRIIDALAGNAIQECKAGALLVQMEIQFSMPRVKDFHKH